MKPFQALLLCVIASTATIYSCKEDKKEEPSSIVGKWKYTKHINKISQNNGTILKNDTTPFANTTLDFLEFSTDGKLNGSIYGNKFGGTYTFKSNYVLYLDANKSVADTIFISELSKNNLITYEKTFNGSNKEENTYHLVR